jgi:hypothetical protein
MACDVGNPDPGLGQAQKIHLQVMFINTCILLSLVQTPYYVI